MIAVCTKCHRMFETTTEDAYSPDRMCVDCYHDERRVSWLRKELTRLAPALAAQHELRADAVDEALITYAAELDAELNELLAARKEGEA